MKKILILICTIFLLSGCNSNKTYHEISYKRLNEMIDNKESFVSMIGSETCSACKSYKVTLNEVISDYNIDVKYIDLSKLSDEEESILISNFSITGTPTTVFMTKGKEEDNYNRIVGNAKYSKIVYKLKENGYIKR